MVSLALFSYAFFSGTRFYQLAFSYFSFFLEGLAISAVTWKSVVLELLATQLCSLGLKPSDKLLYQLAVCHQCGLCSLEVFLFPSVVLWCFAAT